MISESPEIWGSCRVACAFRGRHAHLTRQAGRRFPLQSPPVSVVRRRSMKTNKTKSCQSISSLAVVHLHHHSPPSRPVTSSHPPGRHTPTRRPPSYRNSHPWILVGVWVGMLCVEASAAGRDGMMGRCRSRGNSSEQQECLQQWQEAIEVVIAAPVEKVWAVASDWLRFPRLRCSVECAEGQNGVPGCVRTVKAPNSHIWVAEKLTRIDHARRILSYDLVGGYTGIQAIAEGEGRTRVVWPFMFSPEQVSVDSLTDIVKKKVKAHLKELELLA